MEQEHDHQPNYHQPRNILNFNAPLLSTRRPANSTTLELSCPSIRRRNSTDDHHRIPFSWEKAPGKPKDPEKCSTHDDENDTPRPKLPPSLWRYQQILSTATNIPTKDVVSDDNIGCDADIDDDDINDMPEYDIYSDAVDVFSLSEAIDIVERSQKAQESSTTTTTDGLKMKIFEESRRDNQYPDFIIQRFLPDATALATASALGAMSLKKSYEDYKKSQMMMMNNSSSERVSATTSYSSPKGCGLELLFPWRMKRRLCGTVKSPVRTSSTMQLQRSHKEKRR
ncbi:hypothetical protein L484_013993 [Morus notabilis]|uniref:Uncharacterized protein n=1 Tax=Morus notabilis TaxID=981085 RepID=W9R1U0_9ROSA|nr:uncharacterized protein LOC21397149 [Morus notabilis]EXB54264.1 hypothetical protein L484_013993 [Morus notabilis]